MERREIENLLRGLPETKQRLIAAARQLERSGREDEARRVLSDAAERVKSAAVSRELLRALDEEPAEQFADTPEPTHLISLADSEPASDDRGATELIDLDAGETPASSVDFDDEPTHFIPADRSDGEPRPPGIDASGPVPQPAEPEAEPPEPEELQSEHHDPIKRSGPYVSRGDSSHFVRQATTFVRARAGEHLTVIRHSPARALLTAALTATIVLVAGVSMIYSSLAHAHLDREIDRVERSIEADLYSSHLSALRALYELSDHRILPWDGLDDTVRGFVDHLPLLRTDEKTERVEHLTVFVEARLDYRYSIAGTYRKEPPPAPSSDLLAAAQVYYELSVGDTRSALSFAETSLADEKIEPLARLAYGDALATAGSPGEIEAFLPRLEATGEAARFIRAQLYESTGQREAAIQALESLVAGADTTHVGAHLALARLDETRESASQWIDELSDRAHPHTSAVEQARALVVGAELAARDGDSSARRQDLERASERAPLHPDAVAPLVELLLKNGEIIDARGLLSRTPSADPRHSYFDLALGRTHLLVGDREDARRRLQRHPDHPVAAAKMAVAQARSGDVYTTAERLPTITDHDAELGTMIELWLDAATGQLDEDVTVAPNLDRPSPSPLFDALRIETLRLAAALPNQEHRREDLLTRAEALLGAAEWERAPETRREACLVALDRDKRESAAHRCGLVVERDAASRPSLPAAIRWLLSTDELGEARTLLDTSVEIAGPHRFIDLLEIRLHFFAGDHQQARRALDELATWAHNHPEFHIAEGIYNLHNGRLDRAQRSFERASTRSPFVRSQFALGNADVQLLLDELADHRNRDELRELIQQMLAG